MTDAELSPPRERECERCGRVDRWDDQRGHWRVATVDGEPAAGEPFCVHEWDVDGSYVPFEE